MSVIAVGLPAAIAEALKVARSHLEDKEVVEGLSHLFALGMVTSEATAFGVSVPRPLLLCIAGFLDMSAQSVSEGANLPEGLDESARSGFVEILRLDADGLRAIVRTEEGGVPELWRTPNQQTERTEGSVFRPPLTRAR